MLSRLGILAAISLAISAASAQAETDFPIVGGPGNGSFQDRCPAGEYLVGISGRAGSWVNQIQVVCAAVALNGSGPNHINIDGGRSFGPTRGGGATAQNCAGLVAGIWPHMTPGNRQVKYIDIWCQDQNGFRSNNSIRFNTSTNPATDVNGGADQPHPEICPGQDAAVGLQGRYGADLNAISLICVPLTAPMAAAAVQPPPAQNNRPIKTTGSATEAQTAPDQGPVFVPDPNTANFPPAPPAQRALMPGPFFGGWNITTGDGETFSVNFHQVFGGLQNVVTTKITSSPPPTVKIVRGYTMSIKTYVHLTISVSGQQGDMVLTMAPGGQNFSGVGHLADGTAVSWNGQQAQAGAEPPVAAPTDTPPPQPNPGQ